MNCLTAKTAEQSAHIKQEQKGGKREVLMCFTRLKEPGNWSCFQLWGTGG